MTKGVFVGLSTIDVVYEVNEFPAADTKITARSQSVFIGGPATNAAIAFRHLGGDATLVTVVGRHPLASLIREELARYKVALIELHPGFHEIPVISAVAVNEAGQRNVISANASGMNLPAIQVDPRVLAPASVLMVDGHFMPACQAWASAARHRGIPVVLDAGSWKQDMETLLGSVDTAIGSADFRIPGCTGPDQIVAFLKSRGVRQAAITGGSRPIRWATEHDSGLIPIPEVAAVDTMGAGDILHGAYCWYAMQGSSFPRALEQAAAVASDSCRFRGTRAWMADSAS